MPRGYTEGTHVNTTHLLSAQQLASRDGPDHLSISPGHTVQFTLLPPFAKLSHLISRS